MDEDEVLGKITRLLERGCTMLATHHDCGAPLFRCQGEIVCPVCSFETESPSAARMAATDKGRGKDQGGSDPRRAYPSQKDETIETIPQQGIAEERSDGVVQGDEDPALADLRSAVLLRVQELTAALRTEQDLDKLKRLLDCLEGLLRVRRSLSE